VSDSLPIALGFGLVLGLKHAFEADHLVCVSTFVSEQRSVWRSALVGALWGAGHTAALLVAGTFVIFLRFRIPAAAEALLQLAVGLMTLLLGARLLYLSFLRRRERPGKRSAGAEVCGLDKGQDGRGPAADEVEARGAPALSGWKPFAVGVVHGLAGSAALTLLVLTEVTRGGSAGLGLLYLLVFGAGSVGGMAATSTLIGLSFAITARRVERVQKQLQLIAGAVSVLFGLYYTCATVVSF
jgi:cytochrome c biogenesis protein CcdA